MFNALLNGLLPTGIGSGRRDINGFRASSEENCGDSSIAFL